MENIIEINGLPPGATVTRMAKVAEKFGRFSRLIVEHNGTARLPRATCWITFQRSSDAKRAIRGLHQKVVGGKRVSARWIDGEPPSQSSGLPRHLDGSEQPGRQRQVGTSLA